MKCRTPKYSNRPAELDLCRVVTLASGSGRYGGPFDTACRQVLIARDAGLRAVVVSSRVDGDYPRVGDETLLETAEVRSITKERMGFSDQISLSMIRLLWTRIGDARAVHVSLARELIPVLACIFALIQRKKLVIQPHGMLTSRDSYANRLLDAVVIRSLLKRAHQVIALTGVESADLRELYTITGELVEIGNPVAPEVMKLATSAPRAREGAVFVARLHPRKKVMDFAAAAGVASSRGYRDEYCVVGPDGGDLSHLQKCADEFENLHYEGSLPGEAVAERVNRARVFVLPSHNEPWGNVVATALCLGLPVVVSRSAALAEVIEKYSAGIVFSDGDTVELAEAVHLLLSDNGTYERCVAGAQSLSGDLLSPIVLSQKLTSLYETTLRTCDSPRWRCQKSDPRAR